MDDALRALLDELQQRGKELAARDAPRHERMLNITPETGEFLAILCRAMKARRVLELGTSHGYSTLWLADAVRATSGLVVTVDCSSTKASLAQKNFERAGLSAWVRQEVMDARQYLRQQPADHFDLVFLDTHHEHFVECWQLLQHVLAPGGVLVADNVVSHARELADFLTLVRAAPGWRTVVLPVGYGELVALKPRDGGEA